MDKIECIFNQIKVEVIRQQPNELNIRTIILPKQDQFHQYYSKYNLLVCLVNSSVCFYSLHEDGFLKNELMNQFNKIIPSKPIKILFFDNHIVLCCENQILKYNIQIN